MAPAPQIVVLFAIGLYVANRRKPKKTEEDDEDIFSEETEET